MSGNGARTGMVVITTRQAHAATRLVRRPGTAARSEEGRGLATQLFRSALIDQGTFGLSGIRASAFVALRI